MFCHITTKFSCFMACFKHVPAQHFQTESSKRAQEITFRKSGRGLLVNTSLSLNEFPRVKPEGLLKSEITQMHRFRIF